MAGEIISIWDDLVDKAQRYRAQAPRLPADTDTAIRRAYDLQAGANTAIFPEASQLFTETLGRESNEPLKALAVIVGGGLVLPPFQVGNIEQIAKLPEYRNGPLNIAFIEWQKCLDELGISAQAIAQILNPTATKDQSQDSALNQGRTSLNIGKIAQIEGARYGDGYHDVLAAQAGLRALASLLSHQENSEYALSMDDAFEFARGLVEVLIQPSKYEPYSPPSYEGRIGQIKMILEYIRQRQHTPDYYSLGRGGVLSEQVLNFLQKDTIMRALFMESIAVHLTRRVLDEEVKEKIAILGNTTSENSRTQLSSQLDRIAKSTQAVGVEGKLVNLGDAREQWTGRRDVFQDFLDEMTPRLAMSQGPDNLLVDQSVMDAFLGIVNRLKPESKEKVMEPFLHTERGWYISDIRALQQIASARDLAQKKVLELEVKYAQMVRSVVQGLLQDQSVIAEDRALHQEITLKDQMANILGYLFQVRSNNLIEAENNLYGVVAQFLGLQALEGSQNLQLLAQTLADHLNFAAQKEARRVLGEKQELAKLNLNS